MDSSKRVLVIGGGIVGLSTAYYLRKEGHEVTVVDKSDITSGASFVNAGYLTPSHIVPLAAPGMISKGIKYMFDSSSPFYMKPRFDLDFIRWAWYFKKSSTKAKVERAMPIIRDINLLGRDLYEEIHASGDLGSFHFENKGLLMVYQTENERDHELKVAEKAKELGLGVNHLDIEGLAEVEPNIAFNAKGAFHYDCDRHSTPTQFMERLLQYLVQAGVQIRKNEEVQEVEIQKDKIVQIQTDKNHYQPDEVVLAAGSWTSQMCKKLNQKLPLQAGKGYAINVPSETKISMPAILMEAKMAVTPMDGFTRFAGTMEFSGINGHIRKERVEAIARGAENFYEGLQIPEEDKNKAQCGLRPVSPDGLPYIGKSKGFNNLTIASGHAMMGWSLGPVTGKLVAELVSGNKSSLDLTPFAPDRKF
ncbi:MULTISPECIES: NAD(P)/FAD-dependent oxidoreductase [Flavobacteriaceae]|uniref:NAD(P)/FAD-dependent oxidoreductase n=1 Tax=Flavobacteriaceae TaxID=49546 RepID=UPI0014927368|nr:MULTISPECIES: FAD-dependent oxidoreductase [Allomuricauda]MDC6364481.1 FAD-dependent oxidoreductase [Muricauda sp. AC10]